MRVDPGVTDATVKVIAKMRGFRDLSLSDSDVSDEGMRDIVKLTTLFTLRLPNAKKITDAGLKDLGMLKELQVLDLSGTDATEAGLKEVVKCEKLQSLILRKPTKVTDEGVKELQKRAAKGDDPSLTSCSPSRADASPTHILTQ